jgi:hypothetical protein
MNPCTIASCNGKPICQECRKLNYCPAEPATVKPLAITDVLLSMKASTPHGSRIMACANIACASMAVIVLDDQTPTDRDIDACIGFLRAMKRTKEKAPDL